MNRGKRPKATEDEIGKLENCERPLTNHEWGEKRIETPWVAFEVMGFLEKSNRGESKTVTIDVADEESARPKPPPRAPWEFRTYPGDTTQEPWKVTDPASGSGNHLGDATRKGEHSKGKDPKGEIDPNGKEPKWGKGTEGTDS